MAHNQNSQRKFYSLKNGVLSIQLRPETADSLMNSSMLIQRIRNHQFSVSTKLSFKTNKDNEQAGLIIYRTNESYYMLMKEKVRIVLIKNTMGKRE